MTINLGRYIVRLQQRIKALEGVFTEYWLSVPQRPEVPWGEIVNRNEQDANIQQVASAQQHSLLQAIDAESQDSGLIRALYREFLEED